MECPNCGNKHLLPQFKFCPQCSENLSRASDVLKGGTKERREAITQLSSTSHQANEGSNSDQGVDKGQIEGICVIHDRTIFVFKIHLRRINNLRCRAFVEDRTVDFLIRRPVSRNAKVALFSILLVITDDSFGIPKL